MERKREILNRIVHLVGLIYEIMQVLGQQNIKIKYSFIYA